MTALLKSYQIIWKVGIRRRQEGILSDKAEFHLIKNPWYGWVADPFLFKKEDTTYIFAEVWNYFRQRGSIAYCKIHDGKIGKWKIIISQWYHLSYPFIWEDKNGVHICAETNECQKIYSYRAKEFPDKWVKEKVIIDNGKYADSTFLFRNKLPEYLFTYAIDGVNKGNLCRIKVNENLEPISALESITDVPELSRPGGNFITEHGELFRIAQNCSKSYGESLFFCKVKDKGQYYCEEKSFERRYEDIKTDLPIKCIGMHTYNRSKNYEVVDFRIRQFNIWNFLFSKLMIFCNFIGRNILKLLRPILNNSKS